MRRTGSLTPGFKVLSTVIHRDAVAFIHIPFVKHSIPQFSQNAPNTKPESLLQFFFFFNLFGQGRSKQTAYFENQNGVHEEMDSSFLPQVCLSALISVRQLQQPQVQGPQDSL